MDEPIHKKNPHAVALAKLGARKGGLARAANMSKRKRMESARKAVNARWAKYRVAAERGGELGANASATPGGDRGQAGSTRQGGSADPRAVEASDAGAV